MRISTRATPNGRALARRTSNRGGRASIASVWSASVSGLKPTRWWKREPGLGQCGSAPRISLEEGVREMADWGKRYASQLREASTDYVLRA